MIRGEFQPFLGAGEVEPVLLSLCCTQLNARRKPGGRVDDDLLRNTGSDILESFYRDAIEGLSDSEARFIEDELIQADRYRGSYPRDDAIAQGRISVASLAALTDRFRVLRVDQKLDTARIELIHDRLVPLIVKAREERAAREQVRLRQEAEGVAARERQRREQAELEHARLAKFQVLLVTLALALALALAGAAWSGWRASQQARYAKAQSEVAREAAERERHAQRDASRQRDAAEAAQHAAVAALREAEIRRSEALKSANLATEAKREALRQRADALAARDDATNAQRSAERALAETARARSAAEEASALARGNEQRARAAERVAQASSRRATVLRLLAEGQAVLSGTRPGTRLEALLQVVSAARLAPDLARDAVYSALESTLSLRKLIVDNDGLLDVAISPDGTLIAGATTTGRVRIWNARTGELIRSLDGPGQEHWDFDSQGERRLIRSGQPEAIIRVAFSPDGHRLAAISFRCGVVIWNSTSWQLVGSSIRDQNFNTSDFVFTSDGKSLLSVGRNGADPLLWDVDTGVPRRLGGSSALAANVRPTDVLTLSHDDLTIISISSFFDRAGGGYKEAVGFWDAKSGAWKRNALRDLPHFVDRIASSRDGTLFATGGGDGSVMLWNAKTHAPIGGPLRAHTGVVSGLAFSPDGRTLASGARDGTVQLWDVGSTAPTSTATLKFDAAITGLAFCPGGECLITAGGEGTIHIWDIPLVHSPGSLLRGHSQEIADLSFSPDGRRILSGSTDGSVRIWDVERRQPLAVLLEQKVTPVTSVAFSPDGSQEAAGLGDGRLLRWDSLSGKPLGSQIPDQPWAILALSYSSDGTRITAAGRAGRIAAGSYFEGMVPFRGGDGGLRARSWDSRTAEPLGPAIVKRRRIGDKFQSGQAVSYYRLPLQKLVLSPGGDWLGQLFNNDDEDRDIFDRTPIPAYPRELSTVTGELRQLAELPGRSRPDITPWRTHESFAYSPTGASRYFGEYDGAIRRVKAGSDSEDMKFPTIDPSAVTALAVSSDGRYLADGRERGIIHLWDLASGTPVGSPLTGHVAAISALAFSRDGRAFVSGASDGELRLWPTPPGVIDALCAKVTRNLSLAEWKVLVAPNIEYVVQCPDLPVPASPPSEEPEQR